VGREIIIISMFGDEWEKMEGFLLMRWVEVDVKAGGIDCRVGERLKFE
jgi:hypothetical protein